MLVLLSQLHFASDFTSRWAVSKKLEVSMQLTQIRLLDREVPSQLDFLSV